MKDRKKILVAPLNWGLGHASRCVPIINELLKNGFEVILGADKRPLEFLKTEYPQLKHIKLPGYQIVYPDNNKMTRKILRQTPALINGIYKEHRQLNNLLKRNDIDLVISDNRYGLWSTKIPCIIISHQLTIQAKWGQSFLNRLNAHYLSKFQCIWVPDVKSGNKLSGELSSSNYINKDLLHYIGIISRFEKPENTLQEIYDFIVILSGPEPQRSILEKKVIEQLTKSGKKGVIVQGLPEQKECIRISEHIEMFTHLNGDQMMEKILQSKLVIARSGYTTIMELVKLNKKAILIPTPGQTEQEYLARFHAEKGHFMIANQEELNLASLMNSSDQRPIKLPPVKSELGNIIHQVNDLIE